MKKLERIIIYSIAITALIVGVALDLKITEGLYNPDNAFGQVFEIGAECFLFLLGCFCVSIFIRFPISNNDKIKKLCRILGIVALIGVAFYAGKHTVGNILRVSKLALLDQKWLLIALISCAFIAASYPLTFLIHKEYSKQAVLFAIFAAVVVASGVFTMQVLKMAWLRPRYRTLVALYGDDAASYWQPIYKLTFFWNFDKLYGADALGQDRIDAAMSSLGITKWEEEEFYSFPSGHTMNTTLVLLASLFPSFFPRLKGKELYIRIGVYVLAAIVGVSRIVRGAHNLTDIAFGYGLGVLLVDMTSTYFRPWLDSFLGARLKVREEA